MTVIRALLCTLFHHQATRSRRTDEATATNATIPSVPSAAMTKSEMVGPNWFIAAANANGAAAPVANLAAAILPVIAP